jgi:hypothetical protein
MSPIETESTNRIYGPPKGVSEKDIAQLPVTVDEGLGLIHSFWMPSEVDIANILAGVPIRLTIVNNLHPPVMLTVTNKV